jgi:hypothetical protein
MAELVFEVVQESDGGYCAECLTESIFTEADSWDELRKNVLEATSAFAPVYNRIRGHIRWHASSMSLLSAIQKATT